MADRFQICCTPAWQLKGHKSFPPSPRASAASFHRAPPPPLTAQTFTAVLALLAFVFILQDPGGGSQPPLAPFSWSACPALWEQHPCLQAPWKLIGNPQLAGQRGQPWCAVGMGQDRTGQGEEDRGAEGTFGMMAHPPLWRGTRRSLWCVSCNKTSPRHREVTDWSGVGNAAKSLLQLQPRLPPHSP